MRSKLFVPGSRPELFAKALAGDADAISIDLEDAVVEARKAQARESVRAFLDSPDAAATRKTIIVRVNALDTAHFEADVAAVAQTGLALINLPKPESASDVQRAVAAVQRAEERNGVTAPIGLLLNIETPRALRLALEIATAHPRVAGLQLGYADLFEPLGIRRRDPAHVRSVMFATAMAAGEAGVYAVDGAFADVGDPDGYRAEADMARGLGFIGKSCIHPRQIALANEAFQPSAAEIHHAMKVVQASQDAQAAGAGAYLVDGVMVDAPFVRRAEAVMAMAQAAFIHKQETRA
ncbi:CoA ester lyase [Hydrogenophaga sp. 2FB]|uniref:HpcH/HpaI aldolase/citrate lyase family protein n=1 Tax=Hydrogenophaga sp. 2FB TaxID=2502187 RepID=UPI0010F483F2|nr:CoA ester lyase [Hydrogenophaga sp. 2FB]